jgi:hypothetical protein
MRRLRKRSGTIREISSPSGQPKRRTRIRKAPNLRQRAGSPNDYKLALHAFYISTRWLLFHLPCRYASLTIMDTGSPLLPPVIALNIWTFVMEIWSVLTESY